MSGAIRRSLERLVGSWTTRATHPALPGVVVEGTTRIEWLEGEHFLIYRARTNHPDFPDFISMIGFTDSDRVDRSDETEEVAAIESPLQMYYYDSRGVFRVYDTSIDDSIWRIWREAPGFSQRFSGTIADGGDTILGRWQLSRDDIHWDDDVEIIYRRST